MLSYVEHYRPNFVLIENVVGLVHHKLYIPRRRDGNAQSDGADDIEVELHASDVDESDEDVSGGEDGQDSEAAGSAPVNEDEVIMGMPKFLLRTLIALEYVVYSPHNFPPDA